MKLLAPNVGWASTSQGLLWTTDGGATWKDIDPPGTRVGGAFFLDQKRGWGLLAHGGPDIYDPIYFELASTDNAGASWSVKNVTIPERKYSGSDILSGQSLAFADTLHGWIALGTSTGAAFRGTGILLKTSDGGKTWNFADMNEYSMNTSIGPMLMQRPEQGWIVEDGSSAPLLATRDGGKTWHTIDLESPITTDRMRQFDQGFGHQTYAAYDLPVFQDAKHGYLSVTYPGVLILFRTDDGGDSWKPERKITGIPDEQTGWTAASVVVDSMWITGGVQKDGTPKLRVLGPNDNVTNTEFGPNDFNTLRMSFVTPRQGWVVNNESHLYSTNDGGATWTDITPLQKAY
jgi:photosystem II stability/assembly factor-like uncharacterized protein